MSWRSILKTFLVGTERNPLPERAPEQLGLSLSTDPAEAVLEALAAVNLARKAGFPVPIDESSKQPAGADAYPVCGDAAANDLKRMLSGRYAEALPEYLNLMAQKKLRLPPEYLPDLLEKALRDTTLAEAIRPVLGQRGAWLAQQQPHWRALVAGGEADWFTASFSERRRLLSDTRARNPLLALAWLEKTWPEEKPAHKVEFIEVLHIRLSSADEDLLEKALADKSREVRRAAMEVLVLLPESRVFAEIKHFFKEKLAGFFTKSGKPQAEDVLKKYLPDLSEEALQPWLSVLPKEALSDWRNALIRLFIRLLPPAELLRATGLSPEKVLEKLDDASATTALLQAIVRHNDASWTEAVLRQCSRDFRHAVWQSAEMFAFLTLFAAETMVFLQKSKLVFGYDNQVILRALENYRRPWPKPLLDNLLEQYRRPAYGSGEIPGWHFASALHVAAYHCEPADAAGSAFVRDYLQNPPKARPRELEAFLGVIRFRQKMREHLRQ